MTKEWEALFPKVSVHKLPRDFSDHSPLRPPYAIRGTRSMSSNLNCLG
jgi:hypothetical protein